MSDFKPALVVRLECDGTVIERCSNYCSTTLNLAHALLHATPDQGWKVTIEARQMTSTEFDAMRAKFDEESAGELIALEAQQHIKEATS